jgi:hypothetical protein
MLYRSLRGTPESAEGRAGHRRVVALARETDGFLRRCGWIRVLAIWQPRGRITMRNLSGRDVPMEEAFRREQARRHFLKVEDVDAEVERFRADVAEGHLRALAERIAPDAPMRQEATKRYLVKLADELAGPDASKVLRMVALSVVLFDAESHLASSRLLSSAKVGLPHLALVRWRESAELRLNAKLKTLAYVRNLEESSLAQSLARLRIRTAG